MIRIPISEARSQDKPVNHPAHRVTGHQPELWRLPLTKSGFPDFQDLTLGARPKDLQQLKGRFVSGLGRMTSKCFLQSVPFP